MPPLTSVCIFPYMSTITTLLTITASLLLIQSRPAISSISVTAPFRQQGVTGNITFTQSSPSSPTLIHVSLTGLTPGDLYPWHVHQYPFASGRETPCSPGSVGGHYDPLQAASAPNYTSSCAGDPSLCEIGDLSGRHSKLNGSLSSFGLLTDSYLSLYGRFSIIGRSIVIHFNDGSRYVCANIGYPDGNGVYPVTSRVPLRGGPILGDIYLTQYTDNATVVHTNLINTNVPPASLNHNWHVHVTPVTHGDTTCSSTMGHYDPRGVFNDTYMCNSTYPMSTCEVGDLSGKGGALDFTDTMVAQRLYTDTDLPIAVSSEGYSIANRSIVIHEGPGRIACGDILQTKARKAKASFNGYNDVTGTIELRQTSPVSPTEVRVNLAGLNDRAGSYGVYQTPIGDEGEGRCSSVYTGTPLPPEIGDLSGKFGSLNNANTFNGVYSDDSIPLYGSDSIIGRSIVILDQDDNRLTCADIVYDDMPLVTVSAMFNLSGHVLEIVFVQPDNEPYSDTIITIRTVPRGEEGGASSITSSTTVVQQSTSATDTMTTPPATPTGNTPASTSTGMTSLSVLTTSIQQSTTTTNSSVPSTNTLMMTSSLFGNNTSVESSTMGISSDTSQLSATTLTQQTISPTSILSTTTTITTIIQSIISPSPATTNSTSFSSSFSDESFTSFDVEPTSSMMGEGSRRKRGAATGVEYDEVFEEFEEMVDAAAVESDPLMLLHDIMKREVVSVDWSIKRNNGNSAGNPVNCTGLNDFLPSNTEKSSSLCSMGVQLACPAGALSQKHGTIEIDSVNGVRMVLTDQYLPLSGPDSAIGNLLLISIDGVSSQYVTITTQQQDLPVVTTCGGMVLPSSTTTSSTTATPTQTDSATPTQTDSGSSAGLPLSLPIFIIVCVGGAVALAVIVLLVIVVIVCCCVKRRNRYKFEDYMNSKSTNLELGMYKKTNPLEGGAGATYEVLYDYKPQQDGDLALMQGDRVNILEAPVGGEWWRGEVNGTNGWFPKSYVKYVDVEAEEKKKKQAQLDKAAQVIRAYTLADNRLSANRLSTLNIDSTPRAVTKFDKPLKEVEEETTLSSDTAFPLPNTPPASHTGTPSMDSHRMVIEDTKQTVITLESPPSSNESITVTPPPSAASSQPTDTSTPSTSDVYIAKSDLVPESDSELQLVAGEQVIVLEKNDDGWWHGVVGDRQGWVPETFLEPVQEEGVQDTRGETPEETSMRPRCMTEFHSGTSDEVNVNEYRAIVDYQSQTEGDLSFREGDQVLVYWGNEDGWWFGAAGTAQGYFPGSHVEPVMEETTSSEPPLSPVSDTSLPPHDEDTQSREDLHYDTPSPSSTDVTSPLEAGGGSLADQIAAALKKKQQQQPPQDTNDATTSATAETSSIHSNGSQEASAVLKERSDSVDKLSTDIVAMISGMGTDQAKPKPATLQVLNQRKAPNRTPSRRAPPPPGAAGRMKNKKQKPSALSLEHTPVASIPVAPPPPPLPEEDSNSKETKVPPQSTEGEGASTPVAGGVSLPVVVAEGPGSAGSSPSRRRKPPPPPSGVTPAGGQQLGPSKSPTPTSPSPLVTHSVSKSPTPPTGNNEGTPSKGKESAEDQVDNGGNDSVQQQQQTQVVQSVVNSSLPVSPSSGLTDVDSKLPPAAAKETVPEHKPPASSSSSKWQPQLKTKRGKSRQQQQPTTGANKSQQQEKVSARKKSSTSPKIKVQKVKRPERSIPPPPSAPLPPPPTSRKTSSTATGPPPVKKVLGPPPVKKVLGGPKIVKKATSPPPPPVTMTASQPEKTATMRTTPVKVPPPLTLVNQPETTPTASPDDQTQTSSRTKPPPPSISPKPTTKPKVKPAISPKPKTRPPISPKPRKMVPEPESKPVSDPPTPPAEAKTPEVILRNKSALKPVPPKRVSSLPNTPDSTPVPSPTPQPRSQHKGEETDHHGNGNDDNDGQKTRKVSAPSRPPPPKTTQETTTAPVAPARKKSNGSAPPPHRPSALPKTTPLTSSQDKEESKEENNEPSEAKEGSRKVSDVGVRVKNMMNPMKTLEGRPPRQRVTGTRSLSTPSEEDETTDSRPTPKRRTSHEVTVATNTNTNTLPARPPPPSLTSSTKPSSDPTDDINTQPVPKPRAK